MDDALKYIVGYDNRGTLYDAGEFFIRKIEPDYFSELEKIFDCFRNNSISKYGVVETEIGKEPCTLIHKKYICSYPFEWTVNMYKDAVLFYLNLLFDLYPFGLTLKDALPNNILFNFGNPVFIDFLSLVFENRLSEESWLVNGTQYSDLRWNIVDKMFVPYMLIPLIAMAKNKISLGRTLLFENACNCSNMPPDWNNLYLFIKCSIIRSFQKIRKGSDFIEYIKNVKKLIEVTNVSPQISGYGSYYIDKNENFDFINKSEWKNKQHNIFKILNKIRPKRVLDIGSNTGWFSILAEHLGAEVISIDNDEYAIDVLYAYSKNNKLRILSLNLSFDDLMREKYGLNIKEPYYKDKNFTLYPFFIKAIERFQSDMVICLGLFHHLTWGEGKKISEVFNILSNLSKQVLILEFIDLSDWSCNTEPDFFKKLNQFSRDNYNLELVIAEGIKYFDNVEIMDSSPDTRKLLIFRK